MALRDVPTSEIDKKWFVAGYRSVGRWCVGNVGDIFVGFYNVKFV